MCWRRRVRVWQCEWQACKRKHYFLLNCFDGKTKSHFFFRNKNNHFNRAFFFLETRLTITKSQIEWP